MPWKEQRTMSLKIEFVEKASRKGANMAAICREFGVSRETGYKWLRRFEKQGPEGLSELSRRPKASPLSQSENMVVAIISAKQKYPSWGPDKLCVLLKRTLSDVPSRATIARILKRVGKVVKRNKKRPYEATTVAPISYAENCNDIWTVDFKGHWKTLDEEQCNPLTVRDARSRFILCIKLLTHTDTESVKAVFEKLFKKYGLPKAIQSDNGPPFASVNGRGGLTKLSAWWVSLGIKLNRSRPGKPQDNGAHERMHKDLAFEVEYNPTANVKSEQYAIDKFSQTFNHVRPHEALGMKTPADVFLVKGQKRNAPKQFFYPTNWTKTLITKNGSIRFRGDTSFFCAALAGHVIGLEPTSTDTFHAWLGNHSLGVFNSLPDDARLAELTAMSSNSSRKKGVHER
jgi:putative transposase